MINKLWKLLYKLFTVRVTVLVILSIWILPIQAQVNNYTLQFIGGTFFGPGKMPDVPMAKGIIHVMKLDENLSGITPYFNNKQELPNIASTINNDGSNTGLLSNGIPFNENMDGGIVDVGNGALKLLNVVTSIGPHKGTQIYSLTKQCNWKITTDLALDPGFRYGILVTENLIITSGTVWIPESLQTINNIPGGADVAGSLPAQTPLLGKLGDYDFDGYLDGAVVGKAIIPLDHIFYPGAVVAQLRKFTSSIPISAIDASVLSIYSIGNYSDIFHSLLNKKNSVTKKKYYYDKLAEYLSDIKYRIENATLHLKISVKKNNRYSQFLKQLKNLNTETNALISWANNNFKSNDNISNKDKKSMHELVIRSNELAASMSNSMSIKCDSDAENTNSDKS